MAGRPVALLHNAAAVCRTANIKHMIDKSDFLLSARKILGCALGNACFEDALFCDKLKI
jgi:hypothetical protein